MALGNFARIERIAINGFEAQVASLARMVGIEFRVYKKSPADEYTRVYGVAEGVESSSTRSVVGVLVSYELVPFDDLSIGGFVEGFLYAPVDQTVFEVGDVIEMVRDDSLSKRLKIVGQEHSGQTARAFTRWRVSSIGE